MIDIRDQIFKKIINTQITASIIAVEKGVIAGSLSARKEAKNLGLSVLHWLDDASSVKKGDTIARFTGTPKQIAAAEEILMGHMAKPSGIATAAKKFVNKAGARPKIVSGAWKKMPILLKGMIRSAVAAGGAATRICETPFIYLDKNYIKMLGGIASSLRATEGMRDRKRVVQIHGYYKDIASEACEAAENGADMIFIDTGDINAAKKVIDALTARQLRQKVSVVFAGGIRFEDLDPLKSLDIDILDVGRAILDAPLLDMRMEVEDM